MTTHGHLQRDNAWVPRGPEAAALLAALTISVLVSLVAIRWNDTPDTRFGFIVWWALLSAAATAVVLALDRVARRMAPASALSGFAITFFDPGPNRDAIAAPPRSRRSPSWRRGLRSRATGRSPERRGPTRASGGRLGRGWRGPSRRSRSSHRIVDLGVGQPRDQPTHRTAGLPGRARSAGGCCCLGVATVIVLVVDKISRRLLPLSTLFGLSLVFPDQAPSRYPHRPADRHGRPS